MRKPYRLFSALLLAVTALVILIQPVQAKTKSSSTSATSAPATADATTTPAPANTTTTTTIPTTTSTTTTTTPAAPAPVRAKVINVTDISTSGVSKGSIDVYMSLEDTAKLDDALVGAETPLSGTIELVTVDPKAKKETTGTLRVELPSGKTVKLTPDDKFIRISGIEKAPKDGDTFSMMLHFMRAPNVPIQVTVHKKSSWF